MTLLIAVALFAIIFGTAHFAFYRPVPPTIVEGRVVYGHNGRPAPGVVVHAQTVEGQEPYSFGQRVLTDSKGRYRMPEMREGEYNIWAEQSGFTVEALDSFACREATIAPDLKLVRGGIIKGRVVDAATGQPVRIPPSTLADIGLHGPSRPMSGSGVTLAPLQNDGTFYLRAAPGRNYVYVRWVRERDLNLPTAAWVEVVDGQTVEVELKVPSEE